MSESPFGDPPEERPRMRKVPMPGFMNSKDCDCRELVTQTIADVEISKKCVCIESEFFMGVPPPHWICPDCQKGLHTLYDISHDEWPSSEM